MDLSPPWSEDRQASSNRQDFSKDNEAAYRQMQDRTAPAPHHNAPARPRDERSAPFEMEQQPTYKPAYQPELEPKHEKIPLEIDLEWHPETELPGTDPLAPGWPGLAPESEEDESSVFSTAVGAIAVIVFALLLGTAHFIWQQSGTRPISETESTQLIQTFACYQALVDSTGLPWQTRLGSVYQTINNTPTLPLFPLLAALSQYTITGDTNLLLSFNALGLIALLLGVYYLGRAWLSPGQAWFAAALVGLTPIVIGITALFSPHLFATACVVWGLAALARGSQLHHSFWAFIFAISCGLLLLTHPVYMMYLVAPFAVCLIAGFSLLFPVQARRSFDWEGLKHYAFNIFMVVTVVTSLTIWWYMAQWGNIPDGTPDTPAAEGLVAWSGPVIPETLEAWFIVPWMLLNEAWFAPLALVVVISLITVWLIFPDHLFPLFLTVVFMLAGWALWTLDGGQIDSVRLAPVAVCGSVLAASILSVIPWPGMRGLVMGGMLGIMAILFLNIAYPTFGPLGRLHYEIPQTQEASLPSFPLLTDLVVFKNHLNPGRAFYPVQETDAQPPQQQLLNAILHREGITTNDDGIYVDYVEFGIGGTPQYQHLYGLPHHGSTDDPMLARTPRRIGFNETGWTQLEQAEYVIAILPEHEWKDWESRFESSGLLPVESFYWNAERDVPYQCMLYMRLVSPEESEPVPSHETPQTEVSILPIIPEAADAPEVLEAPEVPEALELPAVPVVPTAIKDTPDWDLSESSE